MQCDTSSYYYWTISDCDNCQTIADDMNIFEVIVKIYSLKYTIASNHC